MTIEIFFDDLREEKQREIFDILGDDGNYDSYPIAVVEVEPNKANAHTTQSASIGKIIS